MINFLQNNKNLDNVCFMLDNGFTLEKQHVKNFNHRFTYLFETRYSQIGLYYEQTNSRRSHN